MNHKERKMKAFKQKKKENKVNKLPHDLMLLLDDCLFYELKICEDQTDINNAHKRFDLWVKISLENFKIAKSKGHIFNKSDDFCLHCKIRIIDDNIKLTHNEMLIKNLLE
jgi:hypothetical protein